MCRCVACNRPMEIGTSLSKDPETGKYEDMCSICREKSKSEYSFVFDHDFITPVGDHTKEKKSGYYYDYFDNF